MIEPKECHPERATASRRISQSWQLTNYRLQPTTHMEVVNAASSQKSMQMKEAYTLFYSGISARREKGWHVHIVLLGNRWKKAWLLYLVLAEKNVLQALGLRKDDSPRIES